jgi:Uma2 family endonuclease
MSVARKRSLISVDDYLAGELNSPIKHEFLDGVVYAMSGAGSNHVLIATNCVSFLHSRLRGKRCRSFNSDGKIRVRLPGQIRFYYPDASVVCRRNPGDSPFQDEPVVIVEVLSQGTRRIDQGEKKDAYLTIPSLRVYALVEQESPEVVVFRKTAQDFVREFYAGLDSVIPLPEIDIELPLAEVYEEIEFSPEEGEEESA